jgi:hypothetical protein
VAVDTPTVDAVDEDLFPEDDEGQRRIIRFVEQRYKDAKASKQGHQDRWDEFYKMYRSYVKKRSPGDWRARLWIPIAFFVIETVTPRLVAQLPEFTVVPVGPEDAPGAELMETLLEWASDQSGLFLELVKSLKSALMYGTGIMKTGYTEITRYDIRREPEMQEQYTTIPMMDENGQMADIDGNPMTQEVPMGAQPTGKTTMTRTPYVAYSGPKAEAVDIDNFFVDPVADSIENARYVIHRVYRDRAHLEEMFTKGIYKKPPDEVFNAFLTQHASLRRQDSVGLSGSAGLSAAGGTDKTMIELLELWTDKTIVTVAGSGEGGGFILLRVERNPYAHGEKPFIRIVDHLVPHEFWGIGELEPLEGLQSVMNNLWNSRIDNVKLVMNTMFLASMQYIEDPSDLQVRPAGVVRVTDGIPLDQAVKPLEMGEVTQSSYNEIAEAERMTEKVSGVSQLTAGTASPEGGVGRTATGLTLMSETGNARFSHKVLIAEMTGFKSLARQFASCIQQYAPEEQVIRLAGQVGQERWKTVTADSIGGRFDFDVEGESSSQTESMRREQTLSLFQMLAGDPYTKPLKIREDVLKVFGRKNVQDYILTPEELAQLMAAQAAAQQTQEAPPSA